MVVGILQNGRFGRSPSPEVSVINENQTFLGSNQVKKSLFCIQLWLERLSKTTF